MRMDRRSINDKGEAQSLQDKDLGELLQNTPLPLAVRTYDLTTSFFLLTCEAEKLVTDRPGSLRYMGH